MVARRSPEVARLADTRKTAKEEESRTHVGRADGSETTFYSNELGGLLISAAPAVGADVALGTAKKTELSPRHVGGSHERMCCKKCLARPIHITRVARGVDTGG